MSIENEMHGRLPLDELIERRSSKDDYDGRLGVEFHHKGYCMGTWFDTDWEGLCPNARLIQRAVNSHDTLVSALEGLCNVCTHPKSTKADMRMIAKEARAALALAQPEGVRE